MAELFIEFNCMCLFATREGERAVHVLMPSTCGHGDENKHVVRLLYLDRAGNRKDLPMEGWALTLADPDPVHDSARSVRQEPRVANLSDIYRMRVNTDLLTGSDPHKLAARVTIDGGEIVRVETQPDVWEIGDTTQQMAHHVTWHIPNLDRELRWEPIGAQGDDPPLVSLDDVQPIGETQSGEPVCRVYVYHVLEEDLPESLPPTGGAQLEAGIVMRHFPMYYGLMADRHSLDMAPILPGADDGGDDPSGMHFCKTAQVWDDLTGRPEPVLV